MQRKTVKRKQTPVPPVRIGVSPASANGRVKHKETIGRYLIQRLQDYGLRDIFGIPGDFVLQFYGMLEESPIRVIGCTREDSAGYAADAYARVHGLGAVCVTYCVGGLSLCNSIAGAFAEKSPVIVISGAPGIHERRNDPLLHHKVRDFNTQREIFEKITVASASLDDPLTAFREIDRCLEAAVRFKRPVYLEMPRDRVQAEALGPHQPLSLTLQSNEQALDAALKEARERIANAKSPVIIAGVEIHRFGLQSEVIALAEKNQMPMCATLLGKSVVSERHPLYMGVYEGAMGRQQVTEFVESSDCVMLLGTFMTDINLGIYTAKLDPSRCIYVTSEQLRIGHHHFHDVLLRDFVTGLGKEKVRKSKTPFPAHVPRTHGKHAQKDKVTIRSMFDYFDHILQEQMVVVADVGDSLFAASDLTIHKHTEFLSPAYYTSMGFALPAALGVQVANRDLRPLVLVGDGAFQMTGMELSTVVRHGFNPIVVVLNNKGYTTERFLQEGPFNDILNWNYHRVPDLLGAGWGFEVRTFGELQQSMQAALAHKDAFSILNVHLEPNDVSPALERLAAKMSKQL
ncbi:alpha-keto acid decarboxylase family protein [Planctomicrobium piriforme]|uniref:Indolepyruvate decarboxylase n=1 Tax=Planctomicrobium piriforme TaxID=1576369 RepID=A0A1I3IZ78_9PLAN|nr:thiamine pyrophosphate-binding protein [Planctomicrobium piriforme]SFI53289.1 indolepyruvate decarboxylase [Planctomicrobium piriforme]